MYNELNMETIFPPSQPFAAATISLKHLPQHAEVGAILPILQARELRLCGHK